MLRLTKRSPEPDSGINSAPLHDTPSRSALAHSTGSGQENKNTTSLVSAWPGWEEAKSMNRGHTFRHPQGLELENFGTGFAATSV